MIPYGYIHVVLWINQSKTKYLATMQLGDNALTKLLLQECIIQTIATIIHTKIKVIR